MASRLMAVLEFVNELEGLPPQNFEARVLEASGQFKEALQMYRAVAIESKANFGELHLETVKTNFRIALMLYVLDEDEEAFTAFEDVYSKLKIISGPDDELALTARGYMANILRRTGKVAMPIYQEIYEILSRKSPDKKITLSIKINMALELCDQGKFSESLDILDEVIRIHRQINSDEEEIRLVEEKKVWMLCKQGKYSEASSIARSLYEERKAAFGENDQRTWLSLSNLGVALADQGEYDQAEDILKVVLKENKKNDDEANIIRNQLILALVLQKHGKLDESLVLLKEEYKNLRNRPLGSIFVLTMKLLAKILDRQGKYKKALRLYRKILIAEKPGSSDLEITSNNIIRIIMQQRKSIKTGPSPNELYEIESKKIWETCEATGKYVEDYP